MKEATEKAEAHKDDPDYFISAEEMFKSIEEEFGFEREKKDLGQETAWRRYIQCTAEYNTECRNIEIRKLRDLLNRPQSQSDISNITLDVTLSGNELVK